MSGLTDAERESLAAAVVGEFIDHPRHNPAHGLGVFDRSRCDRIVAPAVEQIIAVRVSAALNEAADFIRDTSGIGERTNDYADGWYGGLEYAVAELRTRANTT